MKQNRIGLTKGDIRKIEIIYGPECQKRDRLAKIDICKNYPAQRRKREIVIDSQSLRVNRDITVPPENLTEEHKADEDLGIENELLNLLEQVQKVTLMAINNTRIKHCGGTKEMSNNQQVLKSTVDMTKVVETIKDYTKSVIQNLKANLTAFCDTENKDIERGRWRCEPQYCPSAYRSTKSGRVKYSTQHRPIIKQSTKHEGPGRRPQYDNWLRTDNATVNVTDVTDNVTVTNRRRRALTAVNESTDTKSTDTDITKVENVTEVALRMRTIVASHKIVNFAPVRRFERRHR